MLKSDMVCSHFRRLRGLHDIPLQYLPSMESIFLDIIIASKTVWNGSIVLLYSWWLCMLITTTIIWRWLWIIVCMIVWVVNLWFVEPEVRVIIIRALPTSFIWTAKATSRVTIGIIGVDFVAHNRDFIIISINISIIENMSKIRFFKYFLLSSIIIHKNSTLICPGLRFCPGLSLFELSFSKFKRRYKSCITVTR